LRRHVGAVVHDLAVARVLVVDDDPDIRTLVRLRLEASGHETFTAADGEEGLAAVREHRPDLVLADWTMPRLSGVELLGRMRADPETAGIAFILLTARTHDVDAAGVDGFIAKPFSLRELTERVDAVLSRGA
jgi:DNA-binding response OmpR family regulator